jgi:OOP family OmpA-OmpF porin
MKTFVYRFLIACLFVGLCAPFAAGQQQAEPDREGCKDHPLISRYPGSYMSFCEQKEFDEFNFPLGKLVSDGKFTKSQHLEGKITYIEYTAPEGRSGLEVFRNYQAALNQAGFETLFTCVRDGCMAPGVGSGDPKLYNNGAERENWCDAYGMRYLSAKLARPEGDVYVSLFTDQYDGRGADTKLFLVEMKPMQTGMVTVNAAALEGGLAKVGHVEVPGIFFDFNKSDVKPESKPALDEVAKLLKANPAMKVWVVGHTDSVGTLEANMKLSEARAAAVAKALVTGYGISAARLKGMGVGPLSPVASNKTDEGRAKNRRVELVEQ